LKDVDCWGQNTLFQTGNPDAAVRFGTQSFAAPVLAMVSTRDTTCVALDVAGDNVKCWGGNSEGELAVSQSTLAASATPVSIAGVSNARSLDGGNSNGLFCALSSLGSVSCWGGDAISQNSQPVVVATNVVEVAVGTRSEGILTLDGQGSRTCLTTRRRNGPTEACSQRSGSRRRSRMARMVARSGSMA
jgi:hypothetical protein